MSEFSFPALGTVFSLLTDQTVIATSLQKRLQRLVCDFEARYSRFEVGSEVSRWREGAEMAPSARLAEMLALGRRIEELTDGHFSLRVRPILEDLGYGINKALGVERPDLDLGSLGKGYLIDRLAEELEQAGYRHYLVDGGGDMRATVKYTGSPWSILLEHPTDPGQAIGRLVLKNSSIASSGASKRRFGGFHHLLDAKVRRPVEAVSAVTVLAKEAVIADAGATAIFVSPPEFWRKLRRELKLEYLVVYPNGEYMVSAGFPDFSWS